MHEALATSLPDTLRYTVTVPVPDFVPLIMRFILLFTILLLPHEQEKHVPLVPYDSVYLPLILLTVTPRVVWSPILRDEDEVLRETVGEPATVTGTVTVARVARSLDLKRYTVILVVPGFFPYTVKACELPLHVPVQLAEQTDEFAIEYE